MKHLLILMLALCCTVMFIACSSDEGGGNGTGNQIVDGDLNDPSYQFVNEELGGEIYGDFGVEVDLVFQMLSDAAGFDLTASKAQQIGQSLGTNSDDSIVTLIVTSWQYTVTDWFIFQFQAQVREIEFDDGVWDTVLVNIYGGIDSLQLKLDGVVVDSADIDLGVNGFDNRVHAGIDITAPGFLTNASLNHRLQLAGGYDGNDSLGVVNADINDTLTTGFTESGTYCELTINQSTTVTDLIVQIEGDQEGDCPLDGGAATTANLSAFCTGTGGISDLSLTGTWTLTADIENGMRTITVISGKTRWSVTEPNINCD